jgi:hypothetical protein
MRTRLVGVIAVVVGVGLSGCGSDEEPTAAPPSPDVCASADAFRASVAALGDVRVVEDGADSLADAWAAVREDWAQLADDARAEHAEEVDAVQAAADEVQSSVDAAQDAPGAATLTSAATAVRAFVQNAGRLADQVGATC